MGGALLNVVKDWDVYTEAPELFIMVPALLGLKGNLEMTLASRLSTMAHMGQMSDPDKSKVVFVANLAMVQLQAIVIGTLASVFAMCMAWLPAPHLFSFNKVLLLTGTSVVTASVASLVLGVIMILVIQAANRFQIDPDNVATPIAASLGDLATLAIMSGVAVTIQHQPLGASPLIDSLWRGCSLWIVAYKQMPGGSTGAGQWVDASTHRNGHFQLRGKDSQLGHRRLSGHSLIPAGHQWSGRQLGGCPSQPYLYPASHRGP